MSKNKPQQKTVLQSLDAASPENAAPFAEPWHAQVFALAVAMSREGHFSWPEWTEFFGTGLKTAREAGGPEDGRDYYDIWLDTLEKLLTAKGLAEAGQLSALKQAWTEAYLQTPHGKPVKIK